MSVVINMNASMSEVMYTQKHIYPVSCTLCGITEKVNLLDVVAKNLPVMSVVRKLFTEASLDIPGASHAGIKKG